MGPESMKKTDKSLSGRVTHLLSTRGFFVGILGLFILQALWIALSGRYAMAFDENFHVGLIKLYADHLSPFWSSLPAGGESYGALTRDPSYLYHLVMSFPYRVVRLWTDDLSAQVMVLRFLNIGFFAYGLVLFRKVLLHVGASKALVHGVLLLFVLLPVVPLLAAQVNYDNLIMPVLAGALLLAIRLNEEAERYKRINTGALGWLVVLLLVGCLIKYAFLPIALAVAVFIAVRLKQCIPRWRKLFLSVGFGWSLTGRWSRWVLIGAFLIVSVLAVERYGINVVRYHTPVPACDQVLSVDQCNAYGPFRRDHYLEQVKTPDLKIGVHNFAGEWLYGMWFRTFFAVDGTASNYATRGPLLLPATSAVIFFSAGLLAFGWNSKKIWRRYNRIVLTLLLAVIGVYLIALWLDGFEAFTRTGRPVALNGRYLLLIDPLLMLLAALGIREWLGDRTGWKVAIFGVACLGLLWGGGALTYILRSEDSWYWHN